MDTKKHSGSHTPINPVAGRQKLPNSALPSLQVFEEEWSLNGYKSQDADVLIVFSRGRRFGTRNSCWHILISESLRNPEIAQSSLV